MAEILTITNLTKRYGDTAAVDGISFHVQQGEILCLLGPNGAGKSTTIHMLTGALGYDSGEIRSALCGGQEIHDSLRAYKAKLGIVPQDLAIYEDLTAAQNISFFASLYGLKGQPLRDRCEEALAFAGLSDLTRQKVKTFSGGMKRRLNIACAVAHKPELLIMDEPTVGIDPQSCNHILACIKRLRDAGTTIIYTTHYMEEVEEIADRIIIMDHGQLLAQGTSETLKESTLHEHITHITASGLSRFDADELFRIEGVQKARVSGDVLEISSIRGMENLDRIIALLIAGGQKIHQVSAQSASLETVFLNLTGRSLRD